MQHVLSSTFLSTASRSSRSHVRASTPNRGRLEVISEKLLPNICLEVTMFFPCADNASIVALMAAMPDDMATTACALVMFLTLSSRNVTVGFMTRE